MSDPFGMWATDPYHLTILGKTQTGKTVTAREIHAESPRVSVWLNQQGDSRVGNITGKEVSGLTALESGFSEGIRKYNWVSSDRDRDIQLLRSWAWDVAERASRRLPLQIVVDESHRVAPQSNERELPPRDAIRMFSKEGVKRGIKLVLITQDPVALDKQTLRQSEYRLVFRLSAEHMSALSEYGFDFEQIKANQRFEGVLHRDDGTVLNPTVRAKKRYA